MPDWTASMQQSYEYYIVDPSTWKDKHRVTNIIKASVTRDSTMDTLGLASIEATETLGECYIRIYLVTNQNGIQEKFALGTFLVQTPSASFDGKVQDVTMDAYTPLLELKENPMPLGYSLLKGQNIMYHAYQIVRDRVRAPVVKAQSDKKLYSDFVADTEDTGLTFTQDLISNAKYEFMVDPDGTILFAPKQELASLQPVWTYDDSNSSILQPKISIDHDIYGLPNVVEVLYSSNTEQYYARVVNDDENSPLSTVNRGREIVHRVTNPSMVGDPTENQIKEYAKLLLKELSSVEYTLSYTHGYCPVRVGDCVRLNYERAGIVGVKAKVISQTIQCTAGCQVVESAVYTANLWR